MAMQALFGNHHSAIVVNGKKAGHLSHEMRLLLGLIPSSVFCMLFVNDLAECFTIPALYALLYPDDRVPLECCTLCGIRLRRVTALWSAWI